MKALATVALVGLAVSAEVHKPVHTTHQLDKEHIKNHMMDNHMIRRPVAADEDDEFFANLHQAMKPTMDKDSTKVREHGQQNPHHIPHYPAYDPSKPHVRYAKQEGKPVHPNHPEFIKKAPVAADEEDNEFFGMKPKKPTDETKPHTHTKIPKKPVAEVAADDEDYEFMAMKPKKPTDETHPHTHTKIPRKPVVDVAADDEDNEFFGMKPKKPTDETQTHPHTHTKIPRKPVVDVAADDEDYEFFSKKPTDETKPHTHPKISRKPVAEVAADDEDYEFYGQKIVYADDEDNEFFQMENVAEDELKSNFLSGAGNFLKQHGPQLVGIGTKLLGFSEEELFELEHLSYDELSFLKGVGNFVKQNGPTLMKVGTKLAGFEDDEAELFNLGGLIKDGLNIYGDIKNKDYNNLVNHGTQTFKDVTGKNFLGK